MMHARPASHPTQPQKPRTYAQSHRSSPKPGTFLPSETVCIGRRAIPRARHPALLTKESPVSTNPRSPSSAHPPSPRQSRRDFGPLVPLHHVAPERLAWLSPGRLAVGKLTLLDGDPGL